MENESAFPPPASEADLRTYLAWTDWRVLGILEARGGGAHGEILRTRRHYRMVYDTPDVAGPEDIDKLVDIRDRLGDRVAFVGKAENSWYKEQGQIQMSHSRKGSSQIVPLAEMSAAVKGLTASNKRLLYVPLAQVDEAREVVRTFETELRVEP